MWDASICPNERQEEERLEADRKLAAERQLRMLDERLALRTKEVCARRVMGGVGKDLCMGVRNTVTND